ncbi:MULTISPECIES: peptidase E [Paenibacillus]|uniref:Type 1 glutamine amidotransferase-like domain-containing protein n=1 Tax=Paenibacillus TaxID=44249 RepID=UPI0011AB4564|nr:MULTISPECIES: peptidase E [Paenibacillus]
MKQIIAMGGGGFSMEPDNPLLDLYILRQAGTGRPKICFVPTASSDAQGYIDRFYDAFQRLECTPSHLPLVQPPTVDLEDFILDKDIIYVGGGNTKSMLAVWKERSVDRYLKTAWENGVILSGLSAGSICWFEEGVTDSIPGDLTRLEGLGLLSGSHCPHYDGEADRRPSYHRLIQSGQIGGGIAADDGAALHYVDGVFHRAVSSRPEAKAYEVRAVEGHVVETVIPTVYLGEAGRAMI